MTTFFLIIIVLAVISAIGSQSSQSSNLGGPTTISINTFQPPNKSELHCDNCGNNDVNPYNLDSYTFDVKCNKCGHVVWENPKRQERMDQIDSMLD